MFPTIQGGVRRHLFLFLGPVLGPHGPGLIDEPVDSPIFPVSGCEASNGTAYSENVPMARTEIVRYRPSVETGRDRRLTSSLAEADFASMRHIC
jgi:hypothetical protein